MKQTYKRPKPNQDIRDAIKKSPVFTYEVAEALGISANTFLLHLISGEHKQRTVRSQPYLLYTSVRRFQRRTRQRKSLFRKESWSAVPGTPPP